MTADSLRYVEDVVRGELRRTAPTGTFFKELRREPVLPASEHVHDIHHSRFGWCYWVLRMGGELVGMDQLKNLIPEPWAITFGVADGPVTDLGGGEYMCATRYRLLMTCLPAGCPTGAMRARYPGVDVIPSNTTEPLRAVERSAQAKLQGVTLKQLATRPDPFSVGRRPPLWVR